METTPESPWVEHGIQTEDSDWRIHVCPSIGRDGQPGRAQNRHLYFFPTKAGLRAAWAALSEDPTRRKKAKQPGVGYETGDGVAVWPDEIEGCFECNPPAWVWYLDPWSWKSTPSEKGRAAQRVVMAVLNSGYVPVGVPFCVEDLDQIVVQEVNRWKMGHDIVSEVRSDNIGTDGIYRIEVKADFPGNTRGLYLQLAERNPLKRY